MPPDHLATVQVYKKTEDRYIIDPSDLTTDLAGENVLFADNNFEVAFARIVKKTESVKATGVTEVQVRGYFEVKAKGVTEDRGPEEVQVRGGDTLSG